MILKIKDSYIEVDDVTKVTLENARTKVMRNYTPGGYTTTGRYEITDHWCIVVHFRGYEPVIVDTFDEYYRYDMAVEMREKIEKAIFELKSQYIPKFDYATGGIIY